MSEHTPHTHRCACGTRWECAKPDCHIADECSSCEEAAFAEWAEANGYTQRQPVLEPIEALLGGRHDD